MKIDWYADACKALSLKLKVHKKINGMDFLQDFFLDYRDVYFPEVEFDEIDLLVTDAFDGFQKWLGSKNLSWLVLRPHGKWFWNEGMESSRLEAETVAFSLASEDLILLEKPEYDLKADLLPRYLNIYSCLFFF